MSRKKKNKINEQSKQLLKIITIIILLAISIIFGDDILNTTSENTLAQASKTSNNSTILSNQTNTSTNISIEDIPEYTDKIYIEINNNKPYFQEIDDIEAVDIDYPEDFKFAQAIMKSLNSEEEEIKIWTKK